MITEMRPCSDQETRVEEVLVWPEVVPPSTVPEVKEADDRVGRQEKKAHNLVHRHEFKKRGDYHAKGPARLIGSFRSSEGP